MNTVLNVFGLGEKTKDNAYYKNNMPMSADPLFDSENKTQQGDWASAKTPQEGQNTDTQKPWYRFGFGGRRPKKPTKKKKPKKQTKRN
jgi:hypothetical protein